MVDPEVLRPRVRLELSDLPTEYASDDLITQQITEANTFLLQIRGDDISDEDYDICIVAVGAYFTYLSYTALAERQLNQVTPTSVTRLRELKTKARLLINAVFDIDVDDNLNVNRDLRRIRPNAIGMTSAVIDDGTI